MTLHNPCKQNSDPRICLGKRLRDRHKSPLSSKRLLADGIATLDDVLAPELASDFSLVRTDKGLGSFLGGAIVVSMRFAIDAVRRSPIQDVNSEILGPTGPCSMLHLLAAVQVPLSGVRSSGSANELCKYLPVSRVWDTATLPNVCCVRYRNTERRG